MEFYLNPGFILKVNWRHLAWGSGWGHRLELAHPTLGPRRLGHRDCTHELFCPLTSSGIQSMGEATSRISEGRRRVSLGFYSPSSLRAKSLSLATYWPQNMQILSGSPHYVALDPGTVPSSISSILGVEIVPSVANSMLVSLNPANTLISNPFNKLSSKYPIWMFLARTLTDTLRQVI